MSATQFCFLVILSLYYCYFVCSKIPKGIPRLISLFPIFYLFTILPLYLSSAFFIGVTTFFITWLANFKLLAFAFDQGPLVYAIKSRSLLIFVFMTAFPLRARNAVAPVSDPSKIQTNNCRHNLEPNQPTKKIPLNLASEIFIFAIFLEVIFHHRHKINQKLVMVCYVCMMFLMIDILVALSSNIVQMLVGLELESPSNEPYLSTSLQDFWGKRWNLTVTNTLRYTVYLPTRSALSHVVGTKWALRFAVLASFVVSGLMHELLFYYVTRVSPTWEMTSFFVLHGFLVMVEMGLKRALNWRLPWFVSGPLTTGLLFATSFWLFFPPLMRNRADEMVLEECGSSFESLKEKLLQLTNLLGHIR